MTLASTARVHSDVENRCAFCYNAGKGPFCSNNDVQNELILEALAALFAKTPLDEKNKEEKLKALRKTQLGSLLEFSRSVHAEMDALLSAARSGVSPIASRLFVTTFPCHFCARHIVSAGVYEVQYFEPYPKSRALTLHGDAIETVPENWTPPKRVPLRDEVAATRTQRPESELEKPVEVQVGVAPEESGKVLFKPFVGVAPKLYPRVFLKDRDYKDKITGLFSIAEPDWGSPWSQHQVSYAHLEVELVNRTDRDNSHA